MPARRPPRTARPGLEGLESKELLSWNILDAFQSVPSLIASTLGHNTTTKHLSGITSGHYQVLQSPPDTGSTVQILGNGNVTPFGQVKLTGTLSTPGLVRTGAATGTLVFSNSHGTLTVDLLGPQQVGESALPSQFQYKTVSGTGAYRKIVDHGNVFFARNSSSHAGPTSAPGTGAGPGITSSGRFTLAFNSTS